MSKNREKGIVIVDDDIYKAARLATNVINETDFQDVSTVDASQIKQRLALYERAKQEQVELVVVRSQNAETIIGELLLDYPQIVIWYIGHKEAIAADRIIKYEGSETYQLVKNELVEFIRSRDNNNG